jgi:methionyl-tRNA formyltransferase
MRIVVHGQQAFGKAVLDALLKRGENVIAVYVAPEKEGAKADPLKQAALAAKLPVYQPASYRKPEVWQEFRALQPDLQVMAFVTLFVPQEFLNIPTKGSIQYHPSLLPKYRGPSSINWPISLGEKKTGLTIFRPTDGLDEGPVILQKETEISENDTIGTVYFDRLFPMGVKAMLEAADLVVAGKHKEVVQDESQATYEGWFRANESKVNFHNHVSRVHDTIRAADPAPGAWTTINGKKLQLFGSKKHMVRTFGDVKGKIGEITEIGEGGMRITCQGGQVEVAKVKAEDTKKISPSEWAKATGVGPGTILGN